MIKFTKEEISLCKQVAERYRKKIEYGAWYYYKKGKTYWVWDKIHVRTDNLDNHFPLWTISDCLEFFEERGFYLEGLFQIDECEYDCCISEMDDTGMIKYSKRRFEGKTPLEACLISVLAVVKEGNHDR